MEVWKCIEPSFDLGDHHCMPSLRSMAVLVGRAKWQRRARAEKPRGGVLFFSRLCCSFSCTSRANFAASPLVGPARQNRHATQATACFEYLLVIERCPRSVRIKSQGCWQGKIGLCLNPGGTLLYKLVSPYRIGFLRCFGLKTGIHFWSGIGYGFWGNYGSVWTYLSFQFQMSKKKREMREFEMPLKNFSLCALI